MQALRGPPMGGAGPNYQGLTSGYGVGSGSAAAPGTAYGGYGNSAAAAASVNRPGFGAGSSLAPSLSSQDMATTGVASAPKRGMQLGGSKQKQSDLFAAIGQDEGVLVPTGLPGAPAAAPVHQQLQSAAAMTAPSNAAAHPTSPVTSTAPVHIVIDERLLATLNRDGGLEHLEVKGELTLRVHDPDRARLLVHLAPLPAAFNPSDVQFKTHPHVDKNLWAAQYVLGTRDPATKPFPVGQPTPVLKWRYASKEESMVPLAGTFSREGF